MDDQFGGRTDDDLFADEFEPVEEPPSQPKHEPQPETEPEPEPEPEPVPTPVQAPAPSEAPSVASQSSSTAQAPLEVPAANAPISTSASPAPGLLQSRHNQPPPSSTPRVPRSHRSNHSNSNNNNHVAGAGPSTSSDTSSPAPLRPSSAPRQEPRNHGAHNSKANPTPDARVGSGANPRTKLTEAELAEKMEKMRILNAEKERSFKRAEADEQSHAIALENAREAARKRRIEENERKRREAVDRRQMDDERERNRERKLRAMGAKEGGSWDEGKDERMVEEERRRGGYNFRGANGGVRGSTTQGGGLAASRFAATTDDAEFMSGRGARSRGGRGGGRGRGGRGGYSSRDEYFGTPPPQNESPAPATKEPILAAEEFPALPSSSSANKKTAAAALTDLPSPMSPLGRWDDEMAALDAKTAAATNS